MMQFILLINFFFLLVDCSALTSRFIKGADVSFIPQIEDLNGTYLMNGIKTDPIEIFKQNGLNYFRLRLWHSPTDGYCGLASTLSMAARIKQRGLNLLLDIHYSDWWADPSQQSKPEVWRTLTYSQLNDSVYAYTFNVLKAFKDENVYPDMVQIGNEIIGGFLWPEGKVGGAYDTDSQWQQFASLLKAARKAILEVDSGRTLPIMIHIDRGGDNAACRWFFDKLLAYQVPFDIIGLSYYPWWHGTLTQFSQNINDLAVRYGKDIILVETAYPWTLQYYDNVTNIVGSASQLHASYPATVSGQQAFLSDLQNILQKVPDKKGKGIFYWAPEYISIQPIGSPWENLALFDFQGEVLSSIKVFVGNDTITTIVDAELPTGKSFQLLQNYPNPFNPSTKISYILSMTAHVEIVIYNSYGKQIKTLIDGFKEKGFHSEIFTADASMSSGIYFIHLTTTAGTQCGKALLLK